MIARSTRCPVPSLRCRLNRLIFIAFVPVLLGLSVDAAITRKMRLDTARLRVKEAVTLAGSFTKGLRADELPNAASRNALTTLEYFDDGGAPVVPQPGAAGLPMPPSPAELAWARASGLVSRCVKGKDGESYLTALSAARLADGGLIFIRGNQLEQTVLAPWRESLLRNAAVTLATLLGALSVTGWFLRKWLVRDLRRLVDFARTADLGNPPGAPPPAQTAEIDTVLRSVVEMAENLHAQRDELLRLHRQMQTKEQQLQGALQDVLGMNAELERRVEQRTRELLHINRELESFSYSVSHDLRAPVQAIEGFSEVLLTDFGGNLPPVAAAYLSRIHAGSKQMSGLIDDLLKLARLSRSDFHFSDTDLSAICREAAAELRECAPGRNVTVRIDPDMRVSADARLMKIVMTNLIGNAWKFTRGKEHAEIHAGKTAQDGAIVYFVKDNGVGFDMRFADDLFAPFRRLHSQKEFSGNGIGLATVQRIIARHHGKIWAKASPRRGACFYFTIGEAAPASAGTHESICTGE